MDHALIALLALLLNLLLGGPRAMYEASGLARFARIPAKLLRDREPFFTKEGQPILLVGYALAVACASGLLLEFILQKNLQFVEILMVACLLPVRPALERAWFMRRALAEGKLAEARRFLEGTPWKHHVLLDEHGTARAAMELVAVTLHERVLHPLIWYLLLGLPGLFICRTMMLLREALPAAFNADGYINQLLFGIPKFTLWVSSRLAAMIWLMASVFVPPSDMAASASQLAAKATSAAPLPYVIYSVAVIGRVSLGGGASAYVQNEWLGTGSAKVTPEQLWRFLLVSGFMLVLLLLSLALFAY